MIEYFDKPKFIKIRDLFPNSGERYLTTFCYGDVDCYMTTVIFGVSVAVDSYYPKRNKDGEYIVYFKYENINLNELSKRNNLLHCSTFMTYGGTFTVKDLEEVKDQEIEVCGVCKI